MGPNVATVPPDAPFLDVLAARPLAPDTLIIMPTRRAARALAEAYLRRSAGAPMLLPRITALGAIDETPLALAAALAPPPPVPPLRRLAVLARMILAMGGAHGAPTVADRAWSLAAELVALLDEAARAEIDLAASLPGAVHGELAAHWKVTLRFLQIVTVQWPAWLAAEGLADVTRHEIGLIDAQAAAWAARPPAHPVIAAGSTGAIPAVARLLRTVAGLPAGLVLLPGLDRALDEASWESLEATHPQAGLRTLLAALGCRRADVAEWQPEAGLRPALLRQALLPAASLESWRFEPPPADAGLSILRARDQQHEAVAIALILRDALVTPGTRAALVTPDRVLARRVAVELLRFGVVADDSAGETLAETPPAVLLRLLAAAASSSLAPVPLLALLKHPLSAFGLPPATCRGAARRMELACLRGLRPPPGLDGLQQSGADPAFLERLSGALAPLLSAPAAQPAADALRALIQAAEAAAATDAAPGAARLWAGEEGQALAAHLAALLDAVAALPAIDTARLDALLEAALAGVAVRSRRGLRGRDGAEHPRVAIWGLLEARLQATDLIVLGGLMEGCWPPAAESGPWMNREMRRRLGLPAPEDAIGQSAHDAVAAACAAPRAVLSVPRRREGAPVVPSRWLVRLEALLRAHGRELAAHPAAGWADRLDGPPGASAPAPPPMPTPAAALRPRRLAITEADRWRRDAYAIYAKHILRLRPLAPLDPPATGADYGAIVHRALQAFAQRSSEADAAALRADMTAALEAASIPAATAAWWRPRLDRIADWVAAALAIRPAPAAVGAEVPGELRFDAPAGPFLLTGRADRIERRTDGVMAILDYKTGAVPSGRAIEGGDAPQLLLEAAMLAEGGFGADWRGPVGELAYWRLTGGRAPGEMQPLLKSNPAAIAAGAAQALSGLRQLIAAFDDPAQPYLSGDDAGDYATLARRSEWGEQTD